MVLGFLTGLFTAEIYDDQLNTQIQAEQTKDKLLSTASWLAKNKFVENLQSQISFPVKAQLDQTRKLLQQTLNQSGRINDMLLLNGQITGLEPEAIYVTPTSLKALVNAKGNLSARIEKL